MVPHRWDVDRFEMLATTRKNAKPVVQIEPNTLAPIPYDRLSASTLVATSTQLRSFRIHPRARDIFNQPIQSI